MIFQEPSMNKNLLLAFKFIALLTATISAYAAFDDPFATDKQTTASPQTSWNAPSDLALTPATQQTSTTVPSSTEPLSLAEVTDIALQNNPATQIAWQQAKTAAANLGIAKSAYWPQLNAGASVQHSNNLFYPSSDTQSTYGPNVSLSYLIYDFGNRANKLRASQYSLIAANLNQNSQIQQIILQTQQAYYQVLGQEAFTTANEKSLAEAQTSLNVSKALRKHGMATIGDVYQAQAALSQAKLNLQQSQGDYQIALGQLATLMGLPVDFKFTLIPLSKIPPIKPTQQQITDLLAEAKTERPDLLAAQATVLASQAQLAATKAAGRPSVQFNATSTPKLTDDRNINNANVSLNVSVPLFTGYSQTYQVRQNKAQLDQAQATRDQLFQQVQLQVWQAYYALKTAENNIENTDTLLKSNEQAAKQAAGQYKAGVGTMLNMLTTQSSLATARVESIQARLNWYNALAQLSQAVGVLR
jgi:TolC family type I secretion outer membrane protein